MAERYPDIDALFEPGRENALDSFLQLLHPVDVAELFSLVHEGHWLQITGRLTPETLADVLANLTESQREGLGEALNTDRLIEAVEELETDDAADVLADFPNDKSAAILPQLEDRSDIEKLLAYPEDSAGGIMQTELCHVSVGCRVQDAVDAVRHAKNELDEILDVYVVDAKGRLEGTVALQDLVLTPSDTLIREIRLGIEVTTTPETDQEDVAKLFMKHDVAALPVVDQDNVLLGRITFDDIHDVLQEEASEDMMVLAGAPSEDLVYDGAVLPVALLRLPWLVSSLIGSLVTAHLVPRFSLVPGETILLAAFVPVVTAMTGNVGSQSAMIMTRGLAIGRVSFENLGRTLAREFIVGLVMGLAFGSVVTLYVQVALGNSVLGIALGLSMLASMTTAALIGVCAPALFNKWGIDPAIAAGPLVTTICDVLGVSIYLVVALLVII